MGHLKIVGILAFTGDFASHGLNRLRGQKERVQFAAWEAEKRPWPMFRFLRRWGRPGQGCDAVERAWREELVRLMIRRRSAEHLKAQIPDQDPKKRLYFALAIRIEDADFCQRSS